MTIQQTETIQRLWDRFIREQLSSIAPEDRKVFITGHTGFKGAWLTLWLTELGARVIGFSLPPHTDPSLFALCVQGRASDLYGDIADRGLRANEVSDRIGIHPPGIAFGAIRANSAGIGGTFGADTAPRSRTALRMKV